MHRSSFSIFASYLKKQKVHVLLFGWITKYWKVGLVVVSYLGLSFFYMGPVIGDISGSLYGFGDNTAGPVWRNTVSPSNPLGGFEDKTNFPDGENLYSPVGFSGTLQALPLWTLSRTFSPVTAYNLFNIAGFVSTALIMYGFIMYITKNRWIAWLAGFAVSYAPYYQVKIGGHPSYAFSGLFVATIWIFLSLMNKPSRLKALTLGLTVGMSFYFDPYFVLYQVLVCFALLVGWLYARRGVALILRVRELKLLLLSVVTSVIVVLPLLGIYLSSKTTIENQVASVRGNVVAEATACSNYPHEYLLPFVLHPAAEVLGSENTFKKIQNKLKDNFSCGIGEDTVGVSLTILAILSLTGLVLVWERINNRNPKILNTEVRMVIAIATTLLILGFLFALPPKSYAGLPTPTEVMLGFTTTWRTLTRSYMLVNISLVILMALALHYYTKNKNISKHLRVIVYVMIVLLVAVEYQAFKPFKGNQMSSFNLKRDIPAVYKNVKDDKDIGSIAEYPIESYGESDAPSYYISMQLLHGKKILNSPSPGSSQEELRRSIRNLKDPQTIPALQALGIDALVVHGVKSSDLEYLREYDVSKVFEQPRFTLISHTGVIASDNSVIVKIGKSKNSAPVTVGLLEKDFYRNLGIIKGPFEWAYEAVDGAVIKIKTINGGKVTEPNAGNYYCFSIRTSAPGESVLFEPRVDGVVQRKVMINNQYSKFKYFVKDKIVLNNDSKSNMQITSLGCSE